LLGYAIAFPASPALTILVERKETAPIRNVDAVLKQSHMVIIGLLPEILYLLVG